MATGEEGLEAGEARAPSSGVSNSALILLIWLAGASGTLLLLWGSKLSFLLDDWEFLLYRRGFNADAILQPHGEHISVAPILIYKALLATFGMGSAFPFRVVSTALFLLSAVLLFVLLDRRVGQWPALIATAVVLFLGAAWEDLLWAFQVGYFGSMAAGLGALLALEREDRRGDRIACGLLTVSIVFSSLGIPFLIGAAVEVLARRDRWRRLYILLVPAAIYAAWWLGWGHDAEGHISFANLANTPAFVLNSLASNLASALGLASPSLASTVGGLDWGRPLAVAVLVFACWWWLRRVDRVPRWVWILLAIVGSFWILGGLNHIPGREPTSSRYQYVGVVLLFLLGAELLRGVRIGPRAVLLAGLIAAASIVANVHYLHQAYESYRSTSQLEKADLGAVEIARDTVEPGFVLDESLADTAYVHVEAGAYLSAADEFGTPAYSSEELEEASGPARFAADKVLWAALRGEIVPIPDSQVPTKGCSEVPGGAETSFVEVPPGGAVIEAGSAPIERVELARFSTGKAPVDLQGIGSGDAARLTIPEDRSTVPWRVRLQTATSATICGLRAM